MPVQSPSRLGICNWSQLSDFITQLIVNVVFWREMFWSYAGCPCSKCRKGSKNARGYDVSPEIPKAIQSVFKSSLNSNYGCRNHPNWSYFYDIRHEVTIIKSPDLASYVEILIRFQDHKFQAIDGIKGTLILEGELTNFIAKKTINELLKLFRFLTQDAVATRPPIVVLENMVVAIIDPYIIALGRLGGIQEFKSERELLRRRHNNESQFLFPITVFEWSTAICPEQFEFLIKSLLEREPGVKFVRRPAPTNQGDKGRDLVLEWEVLNSAVASEFHPPKSIIKVVGQCKAANRTVGKDKVIDIRDTVETHSATGFFLAVSSQLSAPLTEKLESMRENGIWTNWWNREDIELRLSKNQDLIPLFPDVVKPKNQIKYIEV